MNIHGVAATTVYTRIYVPCMIQIEVTELRLVAIIGDNTSAAESTLLGSACHYFVECGINEKDNSMRLQQRFIWEVRDKTTNNLFSNGYARRYIRHSYA